MRRRDFLTLLSGATAWAFAASAQVPRRTIGVLGSASYGAFPGAEPAFIQGLRATGFLEGENISIEWRWAEGQYDRLSSLAGELVARDVALLVTWGGPRVVCSKGGNQNRPDCLPERSRSSRDRPRPKFQPIYNLVAGLGQSTWSCCTRCFPQPV